MDKLKSSSRNGVTPIWVVLHTAEGSYDDDPANPTIDPGSANALYDYFNRPDVRASSHAICDDDVLLDNLVPYDRAAWTLRKGNPYSDNLEMCGRAGWSRTEWLKHRPMIEHAAKWAARRCAVRGIPLRRLSVVQTARRAMSGIIDHDTYTKATNDGTHWDVGPEFPWDVFFDSGVHWYYIFTNQISDNDGEVFTVAEADRIVDAVNDVKESIDGIFRLGFKAQNEDRTKFPAFIPVSIAGVYQEVEKLVNLNLGLSVQNDRIIALLESIDNRLSGA